MSIHFPMAITINLLAVPEPPPLARFSLKLQIHATNGPRAPRSPCLASPANMLNTAKPHGCFSFEALPLGQCHHGPPSCRAHAGRSSLMPAFPDCLTPSPPCPVASTPAMSLPPPTSRLIYVTASSPSSALLSLPQHPVPHHGARMTFLVHRVVSGVYTCQ